MKKMITPQDQKTYKASSKTMLANSYNVSLRTFNKWLAPHKVPVGEYLGKAYTPNQVKTIIEKLGEPEKIELISVGRLS